MATISSDTQASPTSSTEVPEKPTRRVFTAAYKRSVVERASQMKQPGELGAFLRREGLYSSHLAKWRSQVDQGLEVKRGRKTKPESQRIKQLERENERLKRKLDQAELIIEVQKKVSQLLNQAAFSETR